MTIEELFEAQRKYETSKAIRKAQKRRDRKNQLIAQLTILGSQMSFDPIEQDRINDEFKKLSEELDQLLDEQS
jgi:hypothetical protein